MTTSVTNFRIPIGTHTRLAADELLDHMGGPVSECPEYPLELVPSHLHPTILPLMNEVFETPEKDANINPRELWSRSAIEKSLFKKPLPWVGEYFTVSRDKVLVYEIVHSHIILCLAVTGPSTQDGGFPIVFPFVQVCQHEHVIQQKNPRRQVRN